MLPWIYKKYTRRKTIAFFVSILFAVVFLFLLSGSAAAQGQNSAELDLGLSYGQQVGIGTDDIRLIIARIIRAVLGFLGIVAFSIITYAGYVIMTSEGNEEKISQGKKILINAVIGLAIILSSFAIVQFVINALLEATGFTQGDETTAPKMEIFAGSGALGGIIKDHYPERNQTGVKRNTKIIISFAEPMNPASFIENSNKTCWPADKSAVPVSMEQNKGNDCLKDGKGEIVEYYGDCLPVKEGFDWEQHCDHLLIDKDLLEKGKEQNFHIYKSDEKDKDGKLLLKTPVGAAAMAVYDKDNNAEVFSFRPFKPLGDDLVDVWYTIKLNNNVQKKSGKGAFEGLYKPYYEWQFETDTTFDFSPPHVVGVYPGKNSAQARNTIVQINFNEAMDPMMVQGVLKDQDGFTNIVFNTTTDIGDFGEWKVTNGYRTTEFVSDKECGLNSCGDIMYCLPVGCQPNDSKCFSNYEILIRTAQKMVAGQPFESVPFSGVMDVAGNALDGNLDGNFQDQPSPKGKSDGGVSNVLLIGDQEKNPDNYWWNFIIKNQIDRQAPYIQTVEPSLDAGAVAKDAPVMVLFNREMWLGTFSAFDFVEYREPAPIPQVDKMYFYLRSSLKAGSKDGTAPTSTLTQIMHRDFGPNGQDFYYFPIIPSSVKSLNQNCLYPGRGPSADAPPAPGYFGASGKCLIEKFTDDGIPVQGFISGCVDVQTDEDLDTGCVQTLELVDGKLKQVEADTVKCVNYLKKASPPFNVE